MDELLKRADLAMYEAKAQGRNRVSVFDDRMRSEVSERNELDRSLTGALERDEFVVLYQPEVDMASVLALIEHELYHCGQQVDRYGQPMFTRDATPIWGMKGHDVEEFTGVVRRYGTGGAHHKTLREFVDAANAEPEVAQAAISAACGTCLSRVA